MRVELLLLLSLACLAFTAQAAPGPAQDALRHHKFKKRSFESKREKAKLKNASHLGQSLHKHHESSPKKTRGVPPLTEIQVAQEATSNLKLQEHVLARLEDEIADIEAKGRQAYKDKKQSMHVEDALHIAETGRPPPKFPTITRIGSAIGITSGILNMVNFLFAAKTTALSTSQFSAPPTPPTLIDTAARWDGSHYDIMPVPEVSHDSSGSGEKQRRSIPVIRAQKYLKKRSLSDKVDASSHVQNRMVKRKVSRDREHHKGQAENVKKRMLAATGIGLILGAAIVPGVPSMVMGKKPVIDKPPFDPYDPNMLKQKDEFAAAAADPNKALPVLAPPQSQAFGNALGNPASGPPDMADIRFPDSAYSPELQIQPQPHYVPYYQQAFSTSTGSAHDYSGDSTASSTSASPQPVLRKRALVSEHKTDVKNDKAKARSRIDKRMFAGGPWGRVATAVTIGSVIPLMITTLKHTRWRQYNTRDRDILKDLDDTPTYGAVGVPGRIPGQLATNAMPGYTNYVTQLQTQQLRQQANAQTASQQQYLADQAAALREYQRNQMALSSSTTINGEPSTTDAQPVLRKRDSHRAQTRLHKRGTLFNMGLGAAGLLLGYAQSVTMFPGDKDEERDQKKRERKQQEAEAMAAQQAASYGGSPPGSGGGGAGSFAGLPVAAGDPVGGVGIAYPAAGDGYASTGVYSASGAGGAGAGGYGAAPTYRSGISMVGSSYYGGGGGGGGGFTGGGGSPSLASSLNSAAGMQAGSYSAGGNTVSLRKRDLPKTTGNEHEAQSLSKRAPGIGTFLSVGGTAMFVGTLGANLVVAEKQKHKPVPLVTPNANTLGPMVPGGDLYTQYLMSKRPATTGAGAGFGVGAGQMGGYSMAAGTPASSNSLATTSPGFTPAYSGRYANGAPPILNGVFNNGGTTISPQSYDEADGPAPVLKKRSTQTFDKRAPLGFAGAVEAESAAASLFTKGPVLAESAGGAASLLSKAPVVTETGVGATSRLGVGAANSRFSALPGYSRFPREGAFASEAGLGAFGRNSMAGESAYVNTFRTNPAEWGTSRPATIPNFGRTGEAGKPATLEGLSDGVGRPAPNGLTQQQGMGGDPKAAAFAGEMGSLDRAVEEPVKKGMSFKKAVAILGGGAGASMTFNGLG